LPDWRTGAAHGGGQNVVDGVAILLNAATVSDDTSEDLLTGSAGDDWFLFNRDDDGVVKDRVTDLSALEQLFAEDIDFLNG
jgi:hypothetical protein